MLVVKCRKESEQPQTPEILSGRDVRMGNHKPGTIFEHSMAGFLVVVSSNVRCSSKQCMLLYKGDSLRPYSPAGISAVWKRRPDLRVCFELVEKECTK